MKKKTRLGLLWQAGSLALFCSACGLTPASSESADHREPALPAEAPDAGRSQAEPERTEREGSRLPWSSRLPLERALAEADALYQPTLELAGMRLTQPGGVSALIDVEGANMALGGSEVRVSVVAIGRGESNIQLDAHAPSTEGAEVRRRLGRGLTEWWRALPSGLEHGLTLEERPAGDGPLFVDVGFDGIELVQASAGRIALIDERGARVGTYDKLLVLDASGEVVPAEMAVIDGRVHIEVNDEGASYPLIVDPLVATEEATLSVADSGAFGSSLSMSSDGSRAIVGEPNVNLDGRIRVGRAHVFVRTGTAWTLEDTFIGPPADLADFGVSVSMSADGDRVAVGAPGDMIGLQPCGTARIYLRTGTTWLEEISLTGSTVCRRGFGRSVAISADGGRVVVGDPYDRQSPTANAGSARVFVRSGGAWTLEDILIASDGEGGDNLGFSVSLSGDGSRAVVGAPSDQTAVAPTGSVRVFVRTGSTWAAEATLDPGTEGVRDWGGPNAISISGDGTRVLVGLIRGNQARVFVRIGSGWSEEVTLVAADQRAGDGLGSSVALSADGTRAIVGAIFDDTPGGAAAGSARVFVRSGSSWTEDVPLFSSTGAGNSFLGIAVAISGDGTRVLGGAAQENGGQGTATVFTLLPGAIDGTPCLDGAQCDSGECVDGICCESGCGGSDSDCQSCLGSATGMSDGQCRPISEGTVCRLAPAPCDEAEACDGVSLDCPADLIASEGTVCRAAPEACDVAERCSGSSISCPIDRFAARGTLCHAAVDSCDVEETCEGSGPLCPADAVAPDGTSCGDSLVCNGDEVCAAGVCEAGTDLSCDDSNLCTAESCAEPGGCASTPIAGCCNINDDCGDANVCTADSCSGPGGVCSASPIAGCCLADTDCDDSNSCTLESCDLSSNRCTTEAVPDCCADAGDCDDGNACTVDSCDRGSCANAAIEGCCLADGDCSDDNTCTTDTCELSTNTCSQEAIDGCCAADADCDDGDECTADSCNGSAVCISESIIGCGVDAGASTDAGVSSTDAGGDPGADAGPGSINDAGTLVGSGAGLGTENGGCGCRVGPSPRSTAPFWFLLAGVIGLVARARRRGRR